MNKDYYLHHISNKNWFKKRINKHYFLKLMTEITFLLSSYFHLLWTRICRVYKLQLGLLLFWCFQFKLTINVIILILRFAYVLLRNCIFKISNDCFIDQMKPRKVVNSLLANSLLLLSTFVLLILFILISAFYRFMQVISFPSS